MSTYTIDNKRTISGFSLENALKKDGFTNIVARHASRPPNGQYFVSAGKNGSGFYMHIVWNEKYKR